MKTLVSTKRIEWFNHNIGVKFVIFNVCEFYSLVLYIKVVAYQLIEVWIMCTNYMHCLSFQACLNNRYISRARLIVWVRKISKTTFIYQAVIWLLKCDFL